MHQINEKGHVRVKTVLMVLTMCMASASMGMTASVISTTLGQPSFIKKMSLDGPNGASLTGAMNSLFYVGATWGAFVHGWFANRYGRKPSIIFGVGVITVSQALLAGSVNVAMFIVFRFFLGWGYAFMLFAHSELGRLTFLGLAVSKPYVVSLSGSARLCLHATVGSSVICTQL